MVPDFYQVDYACQTDVGVRRTHNQDNLAAQPAKDASYWQERGHLFLVADGMGAHAVGELASKLAADLIPHTYQKYAAHGPVQALHRAFQEANATIHARGEQNPEFEGMGTTSTVLLLRPEGAWIAHVGDSRCYRVRDGIIELLSYDHSLQWELARRQGKRPEQISGIPKNVIVRSLGPDVFVEVDVHGPHSVTPGDIYVLCSDGLSGRVSDAEIGAIAAAMPPEQACQLLVDLANIRGGPDNITVIVVRVPGRAPAELKGPRWGLAAFAKALLRTWPAMCLLTGLASAVWTVYLILELRWPLYAWTFAGATALLMAGALGFMWRQRRVSAEVPEYLAHPPVVHRRSSCQASPALLQTLSSLRRELLQQAKARGWTIAEDALRTYLNQMQQALQAGELATAFRLECDILLELMKPVRQERNKAEVFQPLWDVVGRDPEQL